MDFKGIRRENNEKRSIFPIDFGLQHIEFDQNTLFLKGVKERSLEGKKEQKPVGWGPF